MFGMPTTIEAELDRMLDEYLDECDELNDGWDLSVSDYERFEEE